MTLCGEVFLHRFPLTLIQIILPPKLHYSFSIDSGDVKPSLSGFSNLYYHL